MIIIGSLLGLAFLFILYMVKEAFSNRVLDHHLHFNDHANFSSVRIFFISDIHRRTIAERIISEALGKTDIVIIGGDLTEENVPLSRVKRNLEKLSQLGPIYFVWGNNDYEGDINKFEALLLGQNVLILKNNATTHMTDKGVKVNLIGIDDLAQGEPDLERAIKQAETNGLRLLLSHNPTIIDSISESHNIQLVLSGHTHGGQIRFLGFGMYENGGIKKVGNTLLFVSNGYGTTALPFRLGAKAQTHLITLSS